MNRAKLEEYRDSLKQSFQAAIAEGTGEHPLRVGRGMAMLLDLLRPLLEDAPDVGPVTHEHPRLVQRLVALEIAANDANAGLRDKHQRLKSLEAYRTAMEAYDLEVHGSLKAVEEQVDALRAQGFTLSERVLTLEAVVPMLDEVRAAVASTVTTLEALRAEMRRAPDVRQEPSRSNDEFAAKMLSGQKWKGRDELTGRCVDCKRFVPASEWAAHRRGAHPTASPDVRPTPMGGQHAAPAESQQYEWVTMAEAAGWPPEIAAWTARRIPPETPVPVWGNPQPMEPDVNTTDATRERSPKRGATPCKVCGTYICLGDPTACDQRAARKETRW